MKYLKFIRYYMKMKKVIDELEYRKAVAEININKMNEKLKNYRGTFSSYERKKLEFYKGKLEGYTNSLLIIEKFIDTGKLPEVKDTEFDK